jgi:hypothetical protein
MSRSRRQSPPVAGAIKHSALAPCPACGVPSRAPERQRQRWRIAKRQQRREQQ